jgi:3-hydroxyisobutyrate dehydrogenase-like beta-hydroxyacid dehydrogenase
MGKHMATNLIAANHHVSIFDVNPKTFEHFKDQSKAIVSI